MLFKKRNDNVKRCPEGHILDPNWDSCPYCEDDESSQVLEPGTGTPAGSNSEMAAPLSPMPPGPPSPPTAASSQPLVPQAPAPPAPQPRSFSPPPPAAPTVSNNTQEYDYDDDMTIVGYQPAQAVPAAPGPPAPQQPAQPEMPAAPPPPPPEQAPAVALPEPAAALPKAPVEDYGLQLAWLIVVSGDYRNRDFRLTSGAVIAGTGADCGIRLAGEQFISGRHGEFTLLGKQCHFRDLNSTNGSFVNDNKVTEVTLTDGDEIRLGNTQFIFKCLSI